MPLKPADFGIIFFVLCAVIFSFFYTWSGGDGRPEIIVKSENNEWIFPADAEETFTVPGPLGNTVVEIRNNRASITASPCINQTCVATGAIHKDGQWAACLPNRIMLYIRVNKANDGIDAAAW